MTGPCEDETVSPGAALRAVSAPGARGTCRLLLSRCESATLRDVLPF